MLVVRKVALHHIRKDVIQSRSVSVLWNCEVWGVAQQKTHKTQHFYWRNEIRAPHYQASNLPVTCGTCDLVSSKHRTVKLYLETEVWLNVTRNHCTISCSLFTQQWVYSSSTTIRSNNIGVWFLTLCIVTVLFGKRTSDTSSLSCSLGSLTTCITCRKYCGSYVLNLVYL